MRCSSETGGAHRPKKSNKIQRLAVFGVASLAVSLWRPLILGLVLGLVLSLGASVASAVVPGARTSDTHALFDTVVVEGMPKGVVFVDEAIQQLLWINLDASEMYLLRPDAEGWLARSAPISIVIQGQSSGVRHVTSQLELANRSNRLELSWDLKDDSPAKIEHPSVQLTTAPGDSQSTFTGFASLIEAEVTPVILSSEIAWWAAKPSEYENLLKTFQQWRSDWESLRADYYFEHYAADFSNGEQTLEEFKHDKRRINGRKDWLKVKVDQLVAIADPAREDLVSVRYYQTYRSSNYNWQGWKDMLWQLQDNGTWQIIFESN